MIAHFNCYGCNNSYVVFFHTCGTTTQQRIRQYETNKGGEDDK
jgi:hypothetical protein